MDASGYLDQLQQLLPPGAAWPRDPDAPLTALLDAIAQEFARVDLRAAQLVEEADPRTTLEMLPDWERLVGLPDACTGQIATTVTERRLAIVGKLTARGGQSVAYLTSLAASLGFDIVVTEYRPLRCANRVGDRCAGLDWAFAFHVDVLPTAIGNDITETWLRAGIGRSGDRIRSFGNAHLECALDRAKPAHTTATYAYPAAPVAAFLYDFTA